MFDFKPRQDYGIAVKQPWELAVMREAGRRLAEVAVLMRDAVAPGISTTSSADSEPTRWKCVLPPA